MAAIGLQQLPGQYCVVQELKVEIGANTFGCPLVTLSNDFYAVHPDSVVTPISVVHECTNSCTFMSIERELYPNPHLFLNIIGHTRHTNKI